jgi:Sec-independent protein translocase protein TatA
MSSVSSAVSGFGGSPRRTIPSVNDLLLVLIVVLIIVVILRGPKTLPQIGRMFGQGVREAREEINKVRADDEDPAEPTRDDTKSA